MASEELVLTTLEQAIADKYCLPEEEKVGESQEGYKRACTTITKSISETALGYRPGNCPVHHLSYVVLDGKGVSMVGEEESLAKLCPRVEELHLSSNSITLWNDVSKIIHSLPSLRLLNLGHNPLISSSFFPPSNGQSSCDHLTTLVLNGTGIDWTALELCLNALPQLQELHLSMNDYHEMKLSKSFHHAQLKNLYLNDNKIERWEELMKLSSAFPSLQKLIASNNPIHCIPPSLDSSMFPELLVLNLNNSALCSWDSIECLYMLRMLRELSVLKIPLGRDMEEKKRRQAFIARLPKIQKLNKSVVTEDEREVSERWLIREMRDVPHPPSIYHELVKKHGELKPLAEVNMATVDKVTMKFHFDGLDREMESREITTNQSVHQLKKWVSKKLVGAPVSTFRLVYCDNALALGVRRSGVLLNLNQKMLYLYRMCDGDEIHVQMK